MKKIDTSQLSPDECWGVQIMGILHCGRINCKFQGMTACQGKEILLSGKNKKGYVIGPEGLAVKAEKP